MRKNPHRNISSHPIEIRNIQETDAFFDRSTRNIHSGSDLPGYGRSGPLFLFPETMKGVSTMEDRNYIMIDGVRYHADRPADCRFCQFWKNRRRGCILGRENCYYLAQVVITEEERKCEGCRYAVGTPCVSACCYKDLERDLWKQREAKAARRKNGHG